MSVDEMVDVLKSKGPIEQKEIDEFKSEYIEQQRFLKTKNNKQILSDSILSAKEEEQTLDFLDPIYTEFFIRGGICYLAN